MKFLNVEENGVDKKNYNEEYIKDKKTWKVISKIKEKLERMEVPYDNTIPKYIVQCFFFRKT